MGKIDNSKFIMKLKNIIIKVITFLGLKPLALRYISNIVHQPPFSEADVSDQKIFSTFTSSSGHQFNLYSGFRDRIKPNWRDMLNENATDYPNANTLKTRLHAWENRIQGPFKILKNLGFNPIEKIVLEIGAYDGATAYAISKHGANRVIATDYTTYYYNQLNKENKEFELYKRETEKLFNLRKSYKTIVTEKYYNNVDFVEDDICNTTLTENLADLIVSWEVLEHITEPQHAIRNIFKALKPGGWVFHEYNPFFSIDGGHSPCTLDFPWGHARLNSNDFHRYIETFRKNEKGMALPFYEKNLNRMTISDLKSYCELAGFEIVALIPWSKKSHLEKITHALYQQVIENYNTASICDLSSPSVWIFMRKPIKSDNTNCTSSK
ncbi:bifunctional 2-polyprenyl-6-hydroxyphenol methylase/3-demethylubiquinol 3-O-methyltransferase UbiG [Zhongshania sp.]|uniref:class I SAM-dependent methyltransferase n=1 Tax=Zhongshania sp. TaxID=1971902 RepID=UPI001B672E11|nr:class I SAM-dependent methyltransferase [Zhongshania sp.]MBQ0797306.1 class I SAM-dependent methyltransferase [Zhongshania sp.]